MGLSGAGVTFARLLVAAAVLAFAACGRSDLDPVATTGASGGTSGGGGTVGGLQLPPTPGFILCGASLCSASSQQCCLGVGASGALAASCQTPAATCEGASLQCDEPADCPPSEVCCFGLLTSAAGPSAASVVLGSRCGGRATCVGVGRLILCRKDSDCGVGGGVCCPGIGMPTCQATCSSR